MEVDDEKTEAVARALCAFEGKDPDQRTRFPGGPVGFQAVIDEGAADGPLLWESYKAEAAKFVVVAEALQPFFKREARW